MSGRSGTGVVLASYGRGALVQSGSETLSCALRGRKQRVVCGDRVHWVSGESDGGPAIDALEPRRNLLERIDARGRPEPVASNLDRVAMVVACEPLPDWFVVDRYWAGARLKDIAALLIVNKWDLPSEDLAVELANYRMLGLPCVEMSARNGAGLPALRAALEDGATLLVGQSGVGKSSLVNVLVPDAAAQTAELTREVEGRHTTTTARRYRLSPGPSPESQSAVIDAPGVRDFAPPATLARAAERGFVEIHERAADCRFSDCRHLEEPQCAVRNAVLAQQISARRYESYRRLYRLYEKLA
jgi:ribosome biogenesis GTPase / thiamine phosphate phosphatase